MIREFRIQNTIERVSYKRFSSKVFGTHKRNEKYNSSPPGRQYICPDFFWAYEESSYKLPTSEIDLFASRLYHLKKYIS